MSKNILEDAENSAKINVHTTEAANKRLKMRYRKERHFRYIGLFAVLLSCLFLVFLLLSIIRDALPVLNQHYLTIEIPLSAADIDPEDKRTAESVSGADYAGLIKAWLRKEFPTVTRRREKKSLYGSVSSNAGSSLQYEVMQNPDLVGKPYKTQVLVSDDADLYFKGSVTDKELIATNGTGTPVVTNKEVRVLSTSNDFKKLLTEVKQSLSLKLKKAKAEIAGQKRLLNWLQQEELRLKGAKASTSDEDRKKQLAKQLEQVSLDLASTKSVIELKEKSAVDLNARVSSTDKTEAVGKDISSYFIAMNGGVIKVKSVSTTEITGEAILPLSSEQAQQKSQWSIIRVSPPEDSRKLSDKEIIWLDKLKADGRIENKFNLPFFNSGASREAEVAGIWGAVVGTFYTMLVTLLLSFPIGVGGAIYLEEFAPKNKITDLIEVNINNLAAVPSIVFGLLGLAVFLNIFGMPRSAPIVGGMVLALMTLPTIIIASRAALKAVPPSIKEAALGLGASQMQAVFHHTMPLAMPGILTGSILGMAQALGETAPLLMIGMVAFIVDIPGTTGFTQGFTDPATVLPVQIYMWADFPEKLFQQKTAAAIVVLLIFLIGMNAIAVLLRKKFERRW